MSRNNNFKKEIELFFLLDFSESIPPESCGFDKNTGEDMFCCSDTSQRVEKPQPPLFPDQNLKPRSETNLLFAATLACWGHP